MSHFDLLSTVQPSDGWFAIVGIKGPKGISQKFAATREEADALVAEFVAQKRNVFFGVAKYGGSKRRVKDNVKGLKAFWLDIDCGEDKAEVNEKTGKPKGYIDQAAGIEALKAFCKLTGLPKPIIVNSGRGLHVYWALEEEITREEWEPVAKRLLKLCTTHDFYIDPAVFEVARILRVPGTFNFKDDPPLPVSVLVEAAPVAFAEIKRILGLQEPKQAPKPKVKRELTELGKSLQSNVEAVFSKIMLRSANGDGCKQLLDCYQNRAALPEPRWFDALSVAKFCSDRDTAIHKLSSGYEDYDPAETAQKIRHIAGPHNCETFERNNPGGCDGCPFKGKITNPISLGKRIIEATEEDNTVEAPVSGEEEPEVHKIPEYPFPFFRGKNGGIYMRVEDEETDDILVYHNDFYITKRVRDPGHGEAIVAKLHRKRDGVSQFTIPNKITGDKHALRAHLADNGVVAMDKQAPLLMLYLIKSIMELEGKERLEQMRTQFGWTDNDTKFIIGDREITPEGTFYSPPSTVTAPLAELLTPKGTLDKWKEVFALYGRPGLEPNAFAALSAFGSPLLKFVGQNGAIINLINSRSGTGKTTALHMCNSVYGDPVRLCTVAEDTPNARIMRLGIMRHLPYVVDEVTNLSAKEFSPFCYAMAAGRGKERMKQSSNELRANTTTWQCISLCSANASIYEKLSIDKRSPEGEMMRLIEYKIDYCDAVDMVTAKHMFDHQLRENYGHAGDIYVTWLISNYEEAQSTVLKVQAKIDAELRLTQRERFWSAVLACNIAGGLIAKDLGLIDWDMKAIYKWATNMLQELRKDVVAPVSNVAGILGDYLNRNLAQHTLVVNDLLDRRSNMPSLPTLEPRGELRVRVEPDTKRIFLAARPFKEDCIKHQISYKDTIAQFKARKILTKVDQKRLSKGMKLNTLPVQCLFLDYSSPDFLDVDGIISNPAKDLEEADDVGGES